MLNLGGKYIEVEGSDAKLTLCDCTGGTTRGYLDSDGLWKPLADKEAAPEDREACDLIGGVITGGRGYQGTYGTFGGGVYVGDDGAFTMTGGSITGNTGNNGGGVFVGFGSFSMEGGSIADNSAGYGGGVYLAGIFTMSGGAITGNSAGYGGGGVYMQNDSSFTMSGSPTITGNTLTDGITANANNVYLNNKKITIDGALSNTTPIGVTTGTSGILTTEWSTYMGGKNPADYFFSDDAAYGVALDGGEAILAEKSSCYTVTFAPNGGTGTMADQLFLNTSSSQALFANTFTRPGYTFTGWNTKADGTGTPYEGGAELTLAEDITLYAQWAYIPPYIPPHDRLLHLRRH